MPVMDEFREEREALKHGTLKQKLTYFADYYKWHVIITVIALGIVISFIVQMLTRKETALYVCMVNTYALESEDCITDFAEFADIDLNSYDLSFDTSISVQAESLSESSIASAQKLMVFIAAGELDIMITDAETIKTYTGNDYFYDLREFLTPEQIERCEPYFYYIDRKEVQKLQEAIDNFDESYVPSYPDPRKPDEMEQPVPVGLYLQESEGFTDNFIFQTEDVVLAVLQNTKRPETARQFIDYVMAEP